MDIRIISSGRIYYEVENTLASLLLELMPGNVERVKKAAPAPIEKSWAYGLGVTLKGLRALQRSKNGQTEYLPSLNRDRIKAVWPDCPDHVIQQWLSVPSIERVTCVGDTIAIQPSEGEYMRTISTHLTCTPSPEHE